jgi:NAD(P)-dependent dehydrogenase (short-subunit alcohol dehydrogenase family)
MGDEQIALVTGASCEIGAEVARRLADSGIHVIVNCRQNAKRAREVADAILEAGGSASTITADISDESAANAMIADIGRRFGRLDTLVLNITGGLRHAAEPGYAMRLNRDAQRRLVELAMPLIPVGGRIIFVTSHQAHFYPNKAVPMGYGPIAASKRAAETALYGMRHEFDRRGIHYTVVSGDMIDGNAVIDLLERRAAAAVDVRGGRVPQPTIDDLAAAIAGAARSRYHPDIVYVGGPDFSRRRRAHTPPGTSSGTMQLWPPGVREWC